MLGPLLAVRHELGQRVDGDREDDGGVVLRGDAVQGLQVAELGEETMSDQIHLFSYFFCAPVEQRDCP